MKFLVNKYLMLCRSIPFISSFLSSVSPYAPTVDRSDPISFNPCIQPYRIPDNLIIIDNPRNITDIIDGRVLQSDFTDSSNLLNISKNSDGAWSFLFNKAAAKGEKVKEKVRRFISGQNKLRHVKLNTLEMNRMKLNPILVFVNRKSGGKLGYQLLDNLKSSLNEIQICDLSSDKPAEYLSFYKKYKSNLRILCCGGKKAHTRFYKTCQ